MCRAHNGLLVRKQRETKRLKNISQGPRASPDEPEISKGPRATPDEPEISQDRRASPDRTGISQDPRASPAASHETAAPPPRNLLMTLPPELRNFIYDLVFDYESMVRKGTGICEKVELFHAFRKGGLWRPPGLFGFGGQVLAEAAKIYYQGTVFVIDVELLTREQVHVVCRWLHRAMRAAHPTADGSGARFKVRLLTGNCPWSSFPSVTPLIHFLRHSKLETKLETKLVTGFYTLKDLDEFDKAYSVTIAMSCHLNITNAMESLIAYAKQAASEGWDAQQLRDTVNQFVKNLFDKSGPARHATLYYQRSDDGLTFVRRDDAQGYSRLVDLPRPPPKVKVPKPRDPPKLFLWSSSAAAISPVPVHEHNIVNGPITPLRSAFVHARDNGYTLGWAKFTNTAHDNLVKDRSTNALDHLIDWSPGYLLYDDGDFKPTMVQTGIKTLPRIQGAIALPPRGIQSSLLASWLLARNYGFQDSLADFQRRATGHIVRVNLAPWHVHLENAVYSFAGILASQGMMVPAMFCSTNRPSATLNDKPVVVEKMLFRDAMAILSRDEYEREIGMHPVVADGTHVPPGYINQLAPAALPVGPAHSSHPPGSVNSPMLPSNGTIINHSGFQNTGNSFTDPIDMVDETPTGDDAEYPGTPTRGSVMHGLDFDLFDESLELFDPNGVANGDMDMDFDLNGSMGGGMDGGTY
ncbi:hypothetical protein LTR15_008081 [Elasticomyces elasticus]|nr:hypothetical protein LTR15_008081 [Elasticomyces elasticus]